MRNQGRFLVGALVLIGLAGCTAAPQPTPTSSTSATVTQSSQATGCPEGARAVAVLSTQYAPASELIFLGDSGVIEERTIPYGGLGGFPGDGVDSSPDGSWWFISNGAMGLENSKLLRLDPKDCSVHAFETQVPGILSLEATESEVYSSNHLNGKGEFRRWSAEGELLAEAKYDDIGPFSLTRVGDRLVVVAAQLGIEDHGMLLVLDAKSLEVIKELPLDDAYEPSSSAILKGDSLIYSVAYPSGGPRSTFFIRVDLGTYQVSRTEAGYEAPTFLTSAAGVDFVGHAGAWVPELLHKGVVTKLLPDGKTDTSPNETAGPILAMRGQGDRLLLLTGEPGGPFYVSAYAAPGLDLEDRWELPSDLPDEVYGASLFTLDG